MTWRKLMISMYPLIFPWSIILSMTFPVILSIKCSIKISNLIKISPLSVFCHDPKKKCPFFTDPLLGTSFSRVTFTLSPGLTSSGSTTSYSLPSCLVPENWTSPGKALKKKMVDHGGSSQWKIGSSLWFYDGGSSINGSRSKIRIPMISRSPRHPRHCTIRASPGAKSGGTTSSMRMSRSSCEGAGSSLMDWRTVGLTRFEEWGIVSWWTEIVSLPANPHDNWLHLMSYNENSVPEQFTNSLVHLRRLPRLIRFFGYPLEKATTNAFCTAF